MSSALLEGKQSLITRSEPMSSSVCFGCLRSNPRHDLLTVKVHVVLEENGGTVEQACMAMDKPNDVKVAYEAATVLADCKRGTESLSSELPP